LCCHCPFSGFFFWVLLGEDANYSDFVSYTAFLFWHIFTNLSSVNDVTVSL